eukprot:1158532-Pelagomonas_calceolata.AAC.13
MQLIDQASTPCNCMQRQHRLCPNFVLVIQRAMPYLSSFPSRHCYCCCCCCCQSLLFLAETVTALCSLPSIGEDPAPIGSSGLGVHTLCRYTPKSHMPTAHTLRPYSSKSLKARCTQIASLLTRITQCPLHTHCVLTKITQCSPDPLERSRVENQPSWLFHADVKCGALEPDRYVKCGALKPDRSMFIGLTVPYVKCGALEPDRSMFIGLTVPCLDALCRWQVWSIGARQIWQASRVGVGSCTRPRWPQSKRSSQYGMPTSSSHCSSCSSWYEALPGIQASAGSSLLSYYQMNSLTHALYDGRRLRAAAVQCKLHQRSQAAPSRGALHAPRCAKVKIPCCANAKRRVLLACCCV